VALHVRAGVCLAGVAAETAADVPVAAENAVIADLAPAATGVGIVAASAVLTDRPRSR
jgi:hypothetical protein